MPDRECFCDYEPAEFYHQATHTARKVHRCAECARAIQPGERYERVRAKWDGTVDTVRTCCRCTALRDHLAAHVPCFCWAHHSLLDDIRNEIEALPAEAYGTGLFFELGRLAVAVKRAPLVTIGSAV